MLEAILRHDTREICLGVDGKVQSLRGGYVILSLGFVTWSARARGATLHRVFVPSAGGNKLNRIFGARHVAEFVPLLVAILESESKDSVEYCWLVLLRLLGRLRSEED